LRCERATAGLTILDMFRQLELFLQCDRIGDLCILYLPITV